jgi:ATP-dependent protease ClpP protease subunit
MRDFQPRLKASRNATGNREWFRVTNKSDETVRIDIMEPIGYDPWFDEGVGAKQFVKELREIKASRIELHVNSPGGLAFDGVTIYNALRDHDAYVVATVDGLAASAASVIVMAADEVVMNRGSEVMVHEAIGFSWGNADDMEYMRDLLDKLSSDIAAIYADRAGGTAKDWRDTMRGEQWYAASEAVEAGLADRLVELKEEDGENAKNRFDLSSPTPVVQRHQHRNCVPPVPN